MDKKFITLFYKDLETKSLKLIIDFFKGLLGNDLETISNNHALTLIFNDAFDIDFKDIALGLNTDFFTSCKLYESDSFQDFEFLKTYVEMISNLDYQAFNDYYFDNRSLVVKGMGDLELIKRNILKKYYNDYEMKEVIKAFLECNMNTSKAANNLYMHRNTVMNKIDKFIEVTGYDIKSFKDAFVIYHLFIF